MAYQSALPTKNADGSSIVTPSRTGAYNEAYVLPMGANEMFFADEGSFFVATNTTVGTGIAGHAAPVVADTDTKALLHLFNGGTKNIYPLYFKARWTAVGANGTSTFWVAYIDNKGATARSSAGTAITPVSTNGFSSNTSAATLFFGPVVTAMTSSKRVSAFQARSVIQVAEDTHLITFGSATGAPLTGGVTNGGTAICSTYQTCAPCVIGPGGNLNISQITVAQTAASSFDFEFGYIER